MKLQFAALAIFAVLLLSVTLTNNSYAQKAPKNEIKVIAENYRKTVQKAHDDFLTAVKKANADARNAIGKGIPIDKINADSKDAIQKARDNMKSTIAKAQADVRDALQKIKKDAEARTSK